MSTATLAAVRVGAVGLDGLLATIRYDVVNPELPAALRRDGRGVIFVLWHGRLLPLTYLHRKQDIVTLISQSGDGDLIAAVVRRWGYDIVRGSSSRRGSGALRELIRRAREGRTLAFTPDGPRGPRQQLKPGVLLAAQLTGLPIVPMAAAASRGWWFGRWDRFLVPQPFARVRVRYGAAHRVPRDAGEQELEAYAASLERSLNELTAQVDAELARD